MQTVTIYHGEREAFVRTTKDEYSCVHWWTPNDYRGPKIKPGETVEMCLVPAAPCLWTYVEEGDYEYHETGCGKRYVFDGPPGEHGYIYCPHCGQRLQEVNDETN